MSANPIATPVRSSPSGTPRESGFAKASAVVASIRAPPAGRARFAQSADQLTSRTRERSRSQTRHQSRTSAESQRSRQSRDVSEQRRWKAGAPISKRQAQLRSAQSAADREVAIARERLAAALVKSAQCSHTANFVRRQERK